MYILEWKVTCLWIYLWNETAYRSIWYNNQNNWQLHHWDVFMKCNKLTYDLKMSKSLIPHRLICQNKKKGLICLFFFLFFVFSFCLFYYVSEWYFLFIYLLMYLFMNVYSAIKTKQNKSKPRNKNNKKHKQTTKSNNNIILKPG